MELYGLTIEDKKTDNVTVRKKELAWVELCTMFNGSAGVKYKRDVASLKACWKNLKAKAKKDASAERRETFLTGGGPPPGTMDPLSQKIIDMMPQQIKPLANVYDDDALADLADQHNLLELVPVELVPVELDLTTDSSSTSERE